MTPLWHFNLERPIAEYSFEQLLDAFKDVIDYAITGAKLSHYRGAPDDLRQEISIVLWKCHQRYKFLPNREFYKIFRKSVGNRVMDFVRFSLKPSQRPPLPMECADVVTDNGRMLSTDFYDRNIQEIFETMDKEGRQTLHEVLHKGAGAVRGRRKKAIVKAVKNLICQ